MLDHADHTTALQSIEYRTAQCRNPHRFTAESAVADDIIGVGLTNIQQRMAVYRDPDFAKADGNRLGIDTRCLDRGRGRNVVKLVENLPCIRATRPPS